MSPWVAMMTATERTIRSLAATAGHPTLTALARAAHVDRHTLTWIVRGERSARAATVTRLATTLSVTEDFVRRVLDGAREVRP